MKSILSLRLLCLLGFLLLIAPFYDQCNGNGMKRAEVPAEQVMHDTTAVETPKVTNTSLIKQNPIVTDRVPEVEIIDTPFYIKTYEFIDVESNQNAFELADISRIYFESSFAEFKKELSKDFKKHKYDNLSLFVRSFSFVFMIFSTFSILILSFTKRIKLVYKLSIVNMFLIVITLICILFFDSLFETYKQIKWGYYAFIMVQLGIFYTSKSQISSSKL